MSGAIENFDFEKQAVRVVLIEADQAKGTRLVRTLQSDPWWVASDIAKALEYRDAEHMCRMLDDDQKGTRLVGTLGGEQRMTIVNESGMWTCVLRSDKSAAKRFRRWLTSVVLPTLRQTGRFDMGASPAGDRQHLSIEEIERITASVAKVSRIGGKAAAIRLWDALGGPPIFDPITVSTTAFAIEHNGLPADSHVRRWFDERIEPAPGRQIETGMLFDDYRNWCAREGFGIMALSSFGRHLSRIVGKSKKSGRCQRVGLSLKVEQSI
jgi:prophage antirepressor-like protein